MHPKVSIPSQSLQCSVDHNYVIRVPDGTMFKLSRAKKYFMTSQIRFLNNALYTLIILILELSTIDIMSGICWICTKDTDLRCPSCKVVMYCSRECQVYDWNAGHSQLCSRLEIRLPPVTSEKMISALDNSTGVVSTELLSASDSLPATIAMDRLECQKDTTLYLKDQGLYDNCFRR